MSFYQRYELVRLVHNGEPKTFEAREITSGRPVLLHLWSMGDEARRSALLLRLRDVMRTDPARLLGAVIEVQESAAPPYVVTAPEEGFPGLDAWLEGRLGGAAAGPPEPAAPAPPPKPAAAPQTAQGEFTRLFGSAAATTPPAPAAPAAPVIPTPPHAAPPPSGGEFTRQFGSAPAPVESTPPKPVPPAISSSVPAFQVAPPFGPPERQAPAKPAAPGQPGEFTRLFGSPLGANKLPVEEIERGVLTPPPATPTERPFRGPSEFTIQFGHKQDSETTAPPPPPPEFPKNLAATGLFAVPIAQQHQPSAQPPETAGPGEFTRVMMRPAGMEIPAAPAAPTPMMQQAPPAPGTRPASFIPNQKPWLGPLIAVLTTLVVLLLIAIIVLLLKR